MSNSSLLKKLHKQTQELKEEGLFKSERIIGSPQASNIQLEDGSKVINFCANNYLGLAHNPEVEQAAIHGIHQFGFGTASVRFICGTLSVHKKLEQKMSEFLQTEDTILYSSCFDANGGCFETLLGPDDAVISDSLNHASIIDGIRLCKAMRYRYQNNDMHDLEEKLKEADQKGAHVKMIVTDGVFSMDGIIANLKGICDLADKYNALVFVDDCHATGFIGNKGIGTPEYCDVLGRIDILTGTFGKALGGASGGYTSGRKEIIAWLRQRSRPYLFSNALAPSICEASNKVIEILEKGDKLRHKLKENTHFFREKMTALGFNLAGKDHAIIPVMLGDAKLASQMADLLLKEGIYVIGFSFPVVPKGAARIRTQMSAAHSKEDLEKAVEAFEKVGRKLGVIQ